MAQNLTKAKNIRLRDFVIYQGKIYQVSDIYHLHSNFEDVQHTYNKLDKREVSFATKKIKRLQFILQCPKTKEVVEVTTKPHIAFRMADKAIVDLLYTVPEPEHVRGNLVNGGDWTWVDEDGQ